MTSVKIITFLTIITAVLYFSGINLPLAQGALGSGIPFGGRVLIKYYCNCSNNYQLFIGPPIGGWFIEDSGTKIYREYNLNPPAWSLGLADANLQCLQYYGYTCVTAGPGGPHIRMVGTSLY